jgi:hypothetical protein
MVNIPTSGSSTNEGHRPLDQVEVRKILQSKEARRLDDQNLPRWPSEDAKLSLAQAVNKRDMFVVLDNNVKFKIRYDDKRKAVFISPSSNKTFIPCGWFSYQQLKDAAIRHEEEYHATSETNS